MSWCTLARYKTPNPVEGTIWYDDTYGLIGVVVDYNDFGETRVELELDSRYVWIHDWPDYLVYVGKL